MTSVSQVGGPSKITRQVPRLDGDLKQQDDARKRLRASRLRKRLEELMDQQNKTSHKVLEKQKRIDEQNDVLLQQTANMVVLADKLNRVTSELATTKSDALEQNSTLAQEVVDRDARIDCLSKTIEDLKTRIVCLTTPSLGNRVSALERDLAVLQQAMAGNIVGGEATPLS